MTKICNERKLSGNEMEVLVETAKRENIFNLCQIILSKVNTRHVFFFRFKNEEKKNNSI